MAKPQMVTCRVCGMQVNDHAERCATCGDQTALRYGNVRGHSSNPWTIIGWIALALILLAFGGCFSILAPLAGA